MSKCSKIANSETYCPSKSLLWEATDFFLVMLPLFNDFWTLLQRKDLQSQLLSHKDNPLHCGILFNMWDLSFSFSGVGSESPRGSLETWLLYILFQHIFILHVSGPWALHGGEGLSLCSVLMGFVLHGWHP